MAENEKLDVLAIGAHPDDIELGCGGTLAKLAAAGRRIGLLHLTAGEAGTRGTPEERKVEARAAAEALGATAVEFLKLGDGHLGRGDAEEDAIIEQLRRFRPEIVLSTSPDDRHPDHGRAHQLVKDACFYAGLRRRAPELGEPYRPAAVFSYMQHDLFRPSFIIDVTEHWPKKLDALACYDSQLYRPDSDRNEPATKVASREFSLAVEGRARHFGLLIGAELGEAFWSHAPLAIDDLQSLAPKGLR